MNLRNLNKNQGLNNTKTSMDNSDDEHYSSSEEEDMSDDYQLCGANHSDDEPSSSEEESLSDESNSSESKDLEDEYSTDIEDEYYTTSDDEDEDKVDERIRQYIVHFNEPKTQKRSKTVRQFKEKTFFLSERYKDNIEVDLVYDGDIPGQGKNRAKWLKKGVKCYLDRKPLAK